MDSGERGWQDMPVSASDKSSNADSSLPTPATEPLAVAECLLAEISDPLQLGTSRAVAGWWVETHTIGCRNHADDPEAEWWERHWAIYDEYAQDGQSTILGDPADGRFATLTPLRSDG